MNKSKLIEMKNIKASADSVLVDVSEEEIGRKQSFSQRVNPVIQVGPQDIVKFRHVCKEPFQIFIDGRPKEIIKEIKTENGGFVKKGLRPRKGKKTVEFAILPYIESPVVDAGELPILDK